jgi:hypothetical protein
MAVGLVATERCYCNKCGSWKPETDFSEFARDQHRNEDEHCICLGCVDLLYKKRLARNEIAGFIKEDRARMIAPTRNPEYEEMTGVGRLGKVMHHSELVSKLQKVVPNLVVWPGNIAGDISLYRIYGEQVDFICYSNEGWLPEFSIVEFNKDMQPIHERRGWRTVLLRIIKFGLLTEELAEKTFGRPSSPQQARFWARRLYDLRNNRTLAKD